MPENLTQYSFRLERQLNIRSHRSLRSGPNSYAISTSSFLCLTYIHQIYLKFTSNLLWFLVFLLLSNFQVNYKIHAYIFTIGRHDWGLLVSWLERLNVCCHNTNPNTDTVRTYLNANYSSMYLSLPMILWRPYFFFHRFKFKNILWFLSRMATTRDFHKI